MAELTKLFKDVMDKKPSRRLVIAFSGGVDSTVLLHLARSYAQKKNILAVHCNHGEKFGNPADKWQKHCHEFCNLLGVEFITKKLQISNKGNLEDNARNERYRFFNDICTKGDLLLPGHHQDDNFETMLIKLNRGASLSGLFINSNRTLSNGAEICRPLLNVPKKDIISYAKEHKLTWIDDPGNQQGSNNRAAIRRDVFPAINNIWKNWRKGWQHSIHALNDDNTSLHWFLANALKSLGTSSGISIPELLSYPPQIQQRLVRFWLYQNRIQSPGSHNFRAQLQSMLQTSGSMPLVCHNGDKAMLGSYKNQLWLYTLPLPQPQYTSVEWNTKTKLELPWGLLSCNIPNLKLNVSYGVKSASVMVYDRQHGSQLQKLWQQLAIPTWERLATPQIYWQDKLVALGDKGLCSQVKDWQLQWTPTWRLTHEAST